MKKVVTILGLLGLTAFSGAAVEQPHGMLLELHSCELYAGGCVVSSEATQGGRYMLRAWSFSGGEFDGTPLAGLAVALFQTSSDNLAEPNTEAKRSVAYLPQSASDHQRSALLGWLKSLKLSKDSELDARVVALDVKIEESKCRVSAGEGLSLETASLDSCPTGSCGEALWYNPRSGGNLFTVLVNARSKVTEPLLDLKWEDAGKKSVFLASFGKETPSAPLYVSLADLCGPSKILF